MNLYELWLVDPSGYVAVRRVAGVGRVLRLMRWGRARGLRVELVTR